MTPLLFTVKLKLLCTLLTNPKQSPSYVGGSIRRAIIQDVFFMLYLKARVILGGSKTIFWSPDEHRTIKLGP